MKLSNFELEVLQIFWHLGEAGAPQIHKEILKTKKVSYSTVKTIIDRLEAKGALERRKSFERSIQYVATLNREEGSKPLLKSLVRGAFAGNIRPVFSYLLEEEELDLEDLAYLEQIISTKKKDLGEK